MILSLHIRSYKETSVNLFYGAIPYYGWSKLLSLMKVQQEHIILQALYAKFPILSYNKCKITWNHRLIVNSTCIGRMTT